MDYDVVIRGGTIVDGSGSAPYRADLAVSGTRIAKIGKIRETGRKELDASGHVVSPGFIDGHTHMDAQVFWDPFGSSSCWHGVTTAVMGHCGFTLAPAAYDQRHLVVRNLERAEDISGAAMEAGIDWTWTTFSEYLDTVEKLPKSMNYAANIGHSALRTYAMGERAFEEKANSEDLTVMERELTNALRAGAIGFTTSRCTGHETSDNRPVASRIASWDEVRHLVNTMGTLGAGMFQFTHEPAGLSPDPIARAEYFDRIRNLAIETHVPFTFGVTGSPNSFYALDVIDETALAGGEMFGLTHCRGIGAFMSFKTRLPFDVLPEWKQVRSLTLADQRVALREPALRQRLIWAAHNGNYGSPIGAEARKPDYQVMQVINKPLPPHSTVGEAALERAVDPVELIIDLALETNFDQFFFQTFSPFDPAAVRRIMKHPRVVMTFSDAGAHVSQISDCSIQTYLLAHWVRDRQDFTIEEAIRMLTLAPAQTWGFHDRGLLREGLIADINVFDPDRITPEMPVVVSDLPGGARRLKQTSSGFLATIVGGESVLVEGEHTGAMPGCLIRGPLSER